MFGRQCLQKGKEAPSEGGLYVKLFSYAGGASTYALPECAVPGRSRAQSLRCLTFRRKQNGVDNVNHTVAGQDIGDGHLGIIDEYVAGIIYRDG